MIKSMTGFGKAECDLPSKKINIEIKTLNSKQIDISLKIPGIFKEKEFEIRNMLSANLVRGKIDFVMTIESDLPEKSITFNTPVIENYFSQLKDLEQRLKTSLSSDIFRTVITLPDAIKIEQSKLDESEWVTIVAKIKESIAEVEKFRCNEGLILKKDILQNAASILNYLNQVEPYEKSRIDRIKKRITDDLNLVENKITIDQNRFEQEFIYYIEKIDISEEKTRLKKHIDYFFEIVENEENTGKKLNFVAQEMGREINTLGSKANDSDIQILVVNMKDELEKIKEQILNIL